MAKIPILSNKWMAATTGFEDVVIMGNKSLSIWMSSFNSKVCPWPPYGWAGLRYYSLIL